MNIVRPNAVYLEDTTPYKKIELCGRTCYKSEDSITEDSSVKFVQAMVKNNHLAMLEHAHIYMLVDKAIADDLCDNKFLAITYVNHRAFLSGSFRTFLEILNTYKAGTPNVNDRKNRLFTVLSDIWPEVFDTTDILVSHKYEVTVFHTRKAFENSVYNLVPNGIDDVLRRHIVHTIKFTCDRGVSHEFVRHRIASFAQESTRYCNYSKEKYNSEITVIKPLFFEEGSTAYTIWKRGCEAAEKSYFDLLSTGATAQEARSVLPNSLKTELVITATEEEWQHIMYLRYHGTTGKPHPQAVEVMAIAKDLLYYPSNDRIK